jgi:hypothetical protein
VKNFVHNDLESKQASASWQVLLYSNTCQQALLKFLALFQNHCVENSSHYLHLIISVNQQFGQRLCFITLLLQLLLLHTNTCQEALLKKQIKD